MTRHFNHAQLLVREEIVGSPTLAGPRACDSRSFDLPGGIYAAMVLLIGGAFAVLAATFRTNMLVSFGIIFALLTAFFEIPGDVRKGVAKRKRAATELGSIPE